MKNTDFFAGNKPRLFAHRGFSCKFPENTLPAFDAAISEGISYLELDVWTTQDGYVVIHHDADLNRTCGVNRYINKTTLSELKALDPGWGFVSDKERPFYGQGITIPTLDELCSIFPQANLNIEIKPANEAIGEQVISILYKRKKVSSSLIASSSDSVLNKVRKKAPEIDTSFGHKEIVAFFEWLNNEQHLQAYNPNGDALQVPETFEDKTLVSSQVLEVAHFLGLEVHVWTVNDPQDMSRLLGLRVDGIMSDDPQTLLQVYNNIQLDVT